MELVLWNVSDFFEGPYLVGHEKLGHSSIYREHSDEQVAWLFIRHLHSNVVGHEV